MQTDTERTMLVLEGRKEISGATANFILAHSELITRSTKFEIDYLLSLVELLGTHTSDSTHITESCASEIKDKFKAINKTVNDIKKSSIEVGETFSELDTTKNTFANDLQVVKDNSDQLNTRVKEIDGVVKKITRIANQTKILSINASVEAARAGSVGRGFAVVAEEVSTLSAQTKNTINEVDILSKNIKEKSDNNKNLMSKFNDELVEYFDRTSHLSEIMKQNENLVMKVSTILSEAEEKVANIVVVQSNALMEIGLTIDNITSASKFGDLLIKQSNQMSSIINKNLVLKTAEPNKNVLSLLAEKIIAHADFLRNVIRNPGNPNSVADHHSCAFGKWYDEVRKEYGNISAFNEIYDVHKNFHEKAKQFSEKQSIENVNALASASLEIYTKFNLLADAFEKLMIEGKED